MASNCGKAVITLLFEDAAYTESGSIVIACDRDQFRTLIESLLLILTCQE